MMQMKMDLLLLKRVKEKNIKILFFIDNSLLFQFKIKIYNNRKIFFLKIYFFFTIKILQLIKILFYINLMFIKFKIFISNNTKIN